MILSPTGGAVVSVELEEPPKYVQSDNDSFISMTSSKAVIDLIMATEDFVLARYATPGCYLSYFSVTGHK